MNNAYTITVEQDGDWWIGWVNEVPGVNSQARTRDELLDNLHNAFEESLELESAQGNYPTSPKSSAAP